MAYCSRTDIEEIYGADNIAKWASLAGTGLDVATHIQHAIDAATEEIDSYFTNPEAPRTE